MEKEAKDQNNCIKNQYFYNSARSAFIHLLESLRLDVFKDIILMPSYIGQSLKEGSGVFDPIRKLKLQYRFYKLNPDLSVNFEDLVSEIDKGSVKVVFVIHYFGFPQKDIEKIALLCKEKNIVLIEDCAHSFSSHLNGKQIGSFGDFSLFSIHKICATQAGGILQVNHPDQQNIALRDLIDQEDLLQYVNSDVEKIARRRRENYQYYLKKMADSKLFEIPFKQLPDGCVPLNFPIFVKHYDRFSVYNKLIEQGVSVVSLWYRLIDEIDPKQFPISADLSSKILNLPVHQDITSEDIDYIVGKLNELSQKKKILVLGGKPIGSLDIVEYAKNSGCYVIVCDYLPKEQSPAKQIADECWNYSTADVDDIVSKAKATKVDAIFTGIHEFNINRCLEVADKLHLPFYATQKDMELSSNKKVYKDIFRQFGLHLIPEYKISDLDDISEDIKFPVLLKPVDGTGAYGLQICQSAEDIRNKMQESLKFSDRREILVERYIQEKEEITSVYIIKDGEPRLASVADRLVKYFDQSVIPLPIGYVWPSKYLNLYEQDVDLKMRKAIEFMGLKNGMLFIQSIVKDGVIMPYDIGFRLSGTQEHIILEQMCGYNPLKLLVDYALTGRFGADDLLQQVDPHFKGAAAQVTFLGKPSQIAKFEGLEDVEKFSGVIRIIKNKLEGEIIPQTALGTLNQVVLRIFVKAATKDKLDELIQKIRLKIKVFDQNGVNILIEGQQ